jgi:serpin B
MVVVVPEAGSFARVESTMSGDSLKNIDASLRYEGDVVLGLPKFKVAPATFSLRPTLGKLGMARAFQDDADFSGIARGGGLKISDVLQRAFITVDEHGTEAAAATAVVVTPTSVPVLAHTLLIDRPFFFYIRDNATGAPIFVGRVVDPTAG